MRNIYLDFNLNVKQNELESGHMTLEGSTGIKYRNRAIRVPGYGWVPCSRKLTNNFTLDPEHLVLVIEEEDDDFKSVTSNIWITRTDVKLLCRLVG